MEDNLRQLLAIPVDRLDEINQIFLNPDMRIINNFLDVVRKYGTPDEINRKYQDASQLTNLIKKVEITKKDYVKDLNWLIEQRDRGVFISIAIIVVKFLVIKQIIWISMMNLLLPWKSAQLNIFPM
jgi:hypothetical protein